MTTSVPQYTSPFVSLLNLLGEVRTACDARDRKAIEAIYPRFKQLKEEAKVVINTSSNWSVAYKKKYWRAVEGMDGAMQLIIGDRS